MLLLRLETPPGESPNATPSPSIPQTPTVVTPPVPAEGIRKATEALRATLTPAPAAAPVVPPANATATPPAPAVETPPVETPPAATETPPVETPAAEGGTPAAEGAAAAPDVPSETPPVETPSPEGDGTPAEIPAERIARVAGRFPGQGPETVAFEDPAVAEAVRRTFNGYMRGEEARTMMGKAREMMSEARGARVQFMADPIGALSENFNSEARAMVARALLADDAVRSLLLQDLALLDTADGIARLADRADAQRGRYREQMTDTVKLMETREKLAVRVNDTLESMLTLLPAEMSPDARGQFAEDLFADIDRAEAQAGKPIVTLEGVLSAVARRAKMFNIEFQQDGTPRRIGAAPPGAPQPPRPAGPAGKPAQTPVVRSVPVVNGDAAKAASAALAGGSRAAPALTSSSPLVAPKGSTLAEATAHLRVASAAASKPPA